jgi:hypothetical protein
MAFVECLRPALDFATFIRHTRKIRIFSESFPPHLPTPMAQCFLVLHSFALRSFALRSFVLRFVFTQFWGCILILLTNLLALVCGVQAHAQSVFPPPPTKRILHAERSISPVRIDGRLDEAAWQHAPVSNGFTEVDPVQGDSTIFHADLRIIFDDEYLYFSAFCHDTLGWSGVRVADLRRDFDYYSNDFIGIALDPFRDERNSQSFYTNPYGSQRDLLSFDDTFFDRDWDAFWRVRTSVTDSGWAAEFAIPWSTLRYRKQASKPLSDTSSKAASTVWGVNFLRTVRRHYKFLGWSPWPRAYSLNRMSYAGVIEGLEPPPPSINLRLQPFVSVRAFDRAKQGEADVRGITWQPGGDAKWAVTPNTVMDVTINTDFAQADADRQVVNTSRFSVFFPERRQFFLESASIFNADNRMFYPFFSRRIGLDDSGNPIPLDVGLRVVHRSAEESIGGLIVRQRASEATPTTWFGVGRYSANLSGGQNRVGAMVTLRQDEAFTPVGGTELAARFNGVGVVDGFFRASEEWAFRGVASASLNRQGTSTPNDLGIALYGSADFRSNIGYFSWEQVYVGKTYNPASGFVSRGDVVRTNPEFGFDLRPSWKPAFVRSFTPYVFAEMYHGSFDLQFQEGRVRASPFAISFMDGGSFEAMIALEWQRLTTSQAQDFKPLPDISIAPALYQTSYIALYYNSDFSAPYSGAVRASTGGYFDGELRTFGLTGRIAPVPHVVASLNYDLNDFHHVGGVSRATHLASAELRLALDPRVQLTAFYQYNTAAERGGLNARFSWEFEPLSFVFLVFNDARTTPHPVFATPYRQSEGIVKVSYLRQL